MYSPRLLGARAIGWLAVPELVFQLPFLLPESIAVGARLLLQGILSAGLVLALWVPCFSGPDEVVAV